MTDTLRRCVDCMGRRDLAWCELCLGYVCRAHMAQHYGYGGADARCTGWVGMPFQD